MIDKAFDIATSKLKKANGDITKISEPLSIFLTVYTTQGVIDNGGFYYFFESNWPSTPPYDFFVNAYKKINCEKQAELINKCVHSFPFEKPHLNQEARIEFMNNNLEPDTNEVNGWGDDLCGDQEVWVKLEQYYTNNENEFA